MWITYSPSSISKCNICRVARARIEFAILDESFGFKSLRVGKNGGILGICPTHDVSIATKGDERSSPEVSDDDRSLGDEIPSVLIVLNRPARNAQRYDGFPAQTLLDDSGYVWEVRLIVKVGQTARADDCL